MLSVIVIVKDEAEHLERCLTSVVDWVDEIIVLDSGSQDDSVLVAKKFTEKVYQTDWQGYGVQKERALLLATKTWVLNLDADESVTPRLKSAIMDAIKHNKADAYRIPILLNFYGKSLYYSWCPKRHIRLFKRKGTHYNKNIIHEAVVLPKKARIAKLKEPICHHSFQNISHALSKMNVYSSTSAKMRKGQCKPSFISAVLGSWWMFFRCYVIQGGFLEGRDGFLLAVLSAEGSFYRSVKMLYPDGKD